MFGQQWGPFYSAGFLIALVLALWAVFNIAQSDRAGPFGKAVWCVVVLFIPYLGFFAWLVFGPRSAKRLR